MSAGTHEVEAGCRREWLERGSDPEDLVDSARQTGLIEWGWSNGEIPIAADDETLLAAALDPALGQAYDLDRLLDAEAILCPGWCVTNHKNTAAVDPNDFHDGANLVCLPNSSYVCLELRVGDSVEETRLGAVFADGPIFRAQTAEQAHQEAALTRLLAGPYRTEFAYALDRGAEILRAAQCGS